MQPVYQVVTVPLSSFVSSPFVVKDTDTFGVWMPVVTSGAWFLQGAYTTNAASADFLPVLNSPPSSGSPTLWFGAGSLAVALPLLAPFSTFRLTSSIAQAAVRSLVLFGKV